MILQNNITVWLSKQISFRRLRQNIDSGDADYQSGRLFQIWGPAAESE